MLLGIWDLCTSDNHILRFIYLMFWTRTVYWPGYKLDDRRILVWFPVRERAVLFYNAPKLAVGPTLPPVDWVSVVLLLGSSSHNIKLTTYIHCVPILGMSGAVYHFSNVSSWHARGQLYLYLLLDVPYINILSAKSKVSGLKMLKLFWNLWFMLDGPWLRESVLEVSIP